MTTLMEVQAQIAALQAQAEELRKIEIVGVIADIKSKMAAYNISPADIGIKVNLDKVGLTAGVPRKIEVKYRDEHGQTWSGRGLKPKWLVAAIDSGKTMEEFRVTPTPV